MSIFFLVLARDKKFVTEKIRELEMLDVPYVIVCGERLSHPNVVYRPPIGKYDAINFGINLIPENVDMIALNDVDTKIHNFDQALQYFADSNVDLLLTTEMIKEGPQVSFFTLLNPIRRRIFLAASGELMLIRRDVLEKVLPLKPCKAEDTYILFKVLELGYRVIFCEECYAETERTKTPEKEEDYKRRTVGGIYQALSYTHAPLPIKLFYILLPFVSPLFLILGKKGYFWMKGILLGFLDYLRGDRSGMWKATYTK